MFYQTPEYAANPPSTGTTTPLTKPEALSERSQSRVPSRSSGTPNLPMGVWEIILSLLGVRLPSSLKSRAWFCAVAKKPGAMALTRMPIFEKWTASHMVKLDTAAFAAEYAGIFVRGQKEFIDETLMITGA